MMWKHTLDFISQVPEFCCLRNWMLWFACHNQDTYWEMYYRVQNTTLWVVWWVYFNVWVNIFERNTPHSYHHRVISELKLKDKSLHLKGLKVRGLLTCQVSLLDFLLHSWDRRKGRGIYIYKGLFLKGLSCSIWSITELLKSTEGCIYLHEHNFPWKFLRE